MSPMKKAGAPPRYAGFFMHKCCKAQQPALIGEPQRPSSRAKPSGKGVAGATR